MSTPSKKRKRAPFTLRCIGFCGADDSIEPLLLAAISARHQWVEWGLLFRPDKAGKPRYASEVWLERLAAANAGRAMQLAGHLCSTRVDEVLNGDATFVKEVSEKVGIGRFQINATKANGTNMSAFSTPEGADRCVSHLRSVFASLPNIEFIVQRNVETKPLWERLLEDTPPNMSILFDDSMGLGVESDTFAPPPTQPVKFGYAGGLSPGNLSLKLDSMGKAAAGHTLWCDMETSLRTILQDGTDTFDANKAMACVRCVIEEGFADAAE
jgi:hypothetical protein